MSNPSPINIILLGDPAAGKATHGKFLEARYKLYNLDMGQELRSIKKQEVRSKYKLGDTLDKGKLTPTEIVRKILQDRIHNTPKTRGILFNGTPKMLGEAKLVAKWLGAEKRDNVLFVYLSIPLKETIRRMTSRKTYFKGKFSKRMDDTNEALKNRVNYYRKNIAQVVDFFYRRYPFKKVNGVGSVLAVHRRILEAIKNLENKN